MVKHCSCKTLFIEFYPIVVAVQMFGIKLANKHINFHCDNKAVVQVINKQSCKDPKLMKLTRHLVLTSMQYNIEFSASHIPGKINHLPDALSRLQMTSELLKQYGMEENPTIAPSVAGELQSNLKNILQAIYLFIYSGLTTCCGLMKTISRHTQVFFNQNNSVNTMVPFI